MFVLYRTQLAYLIGFMSTICYFLFIFFPQIFYSSVSLLLSFEVIKQFQYCILIFLLAFYYTSAYF